jgi:hypothetical protein
MQRSKFAAKREKGQASLFSFGSSEESDEAEDGGKEGGSSEFVSDTSHGESSDASSNSDDVVL